MSLIEDSQKAVEYLEHLQHRLWSKNDHSQDDDLGSIICMLESPMFRHLLTLQESLQELSHISSSQPLTEDSFDITASGELILNESSDGFAPENIADTSTLKLRGRPYVNLASSQASYELDSELVETVDRMADGRPVHVIHLEKTEHASLGFSVIGVKDDNTGELGIFVRDIQPGGLAAIDGRLQEGDQLLVVNGQPLEVSQQEAIRVLQSAKGRAEFVVARDSRTNLTQQVLEAAPGAATSRTTGAEDKGEEPAEEDGEGEEEEEEEEKHSQKSDMVLSTDWTQLEVIELFNDGTGLGFGIIGGRSTGVVVKTILPGGIADQDGHLRSGDHILQIGDVNVRGMSSEQVALVLRQSGSHVRLVVARSVHELPQFNNPHAPIIPTHQLDEHMEHFNAVMALEAGDHDLHLQHLQQLQQQQQQQQILIGSVQVHAPPDLIEDVHDVDVFEVDLMKDSHGLGITIAGYVGGDNAPDEISGIFVKSITEGSAAAMDGRVHVNDQIIEVDGKSLQGFSNHQAVEVLKNTGQMVRLKLVRFRHGPKYDKLQEYLAQANKSVSVQPTLAKEIPPVPGLSFETESRQVDHEDVHVFTDDYSGELSPDVEAAIKAAWEPIVGNDFLVVVAQLAKFKEGGGLGISLEGTVDVEDGVEVRPHHYIRSILPDGPVGLSGRLKSSDELLEVNGRRLLGLNHVSVVEILKDLPQHVRLVCARRKTPLPDSFNQPEMKIPVPLPSLTHSKRPDPGPPATERLVKAKSEMALPTSELPALGHLSKSKSRSLEPLTGLAMWSSKPVVIELEKGDRGLGFSILDYQDPVNPNETVIVIRSLVPGGVAQLDGRLIPGDRLIFVNNVNVEHATLDEAVQALKGAARGIVKIGVAKPLPLTESFMQDPQLSPHIDSGAVPTFSQPYTREEDSLPHISTALGRGLDDNATLALHSEAELSLRALESEIAQAEDHPAYASSLDEINQGVAFEYAADSMDRRFFGSGQSGASQGLAFAYSDSSSDAELSRLDTRRKDSFYESDEDVRAPKKVSPLRVEPVAETPLGYGLSRPPEFERVPRAAAVVKPPRAGKPKKDKMIDGLSDVSAVIKADVATESPTVEPYGHYESLAEDGGRFASLAAEAVRNEAGPTLSFTKAPPEVAGPEESEAEEAAPPAPPPRDRLAESVTEEVTLSAFLSQGAPIAKLDSAEFESDQTTSRMPEGSTSPRSGPPRKGPPPIPPKPKTKLPQSSLLIITQQKEAPPPLPETSPPPAVTAYAPPLTPPLRPAPSSPKWGDADIKLHGKSAFGHRKTSSSSSSEHMTSSDLKTPPSSPRTQSPGHSGLASPALSRVSSALEQTVHIQKGGQHLGLTVEAVDKATNGCLVKSIAKPSAVDQDGRIQPGDYIVSVNNESLRRITNAQARAILRRSSLLGSDITITYISGLATGRSSQTPAAEPQQSPLLHKIAQSLKSEEALLAAQAPEPDTKTSSLETQAPRQESPVEAKPGTYLGQKTLQTDGSSAVGNQAWGPPRTVELIREPGKSLGISIVGGRVDMFNVSQEHLNAGIFIKHVLPDSPAGRNGTLKKGDRILEVNGCDVRNATHDEAVEVIRNSSSPITFLLQSLSYSSCPGDLESSQLKAVQSFEDSALVAHSSATSSPGSTPHQSFEQVDVRLASESVSDSEDEDEFGYTKKRIQKKYSDLPGVVQLVDLNRGSAGMGLGLAGNKDRSKMSVFVAGIQPDSPADRDGRIQIGDELLEVNGISLNGLSHLNASATIKGVTTPVVKLITHRSEDFLEHMAVKPLRYGGSSQFDVQVFPPVSPRGSGDTDTTSSNNSRRESSVVSHSPSSAAVPAGAVSPSLGQMLTPADTIQVITLQKPSSQSLGFGIQEDNKNGRQGIYVNSITQGGIADKDHQLEIGDEILDVGDKSLAGLHYDKAIDILRAAQGSVQLKVRKSNQSGNLIAGSAGGAQGKVQLLNTLGESTTDPADAEENGDPETCPIVLGKRTYIEIEKGKTGLGLSIVGGSDTLLGAIIIHEVYEDGAAARDGRLWAGDQILEVNGEDLTDATHNHALQVLRQTPAVVRMAVYRDESQVQEDDILDVFSVDLVKRPGKGLGLSIVGKKSDVGIYISDIVKGGVAEADGRLMQGDQILAVNGEDMRNATQEYAASILKTLMGKVNLTVGRLKAGSKASSRKNSNHGTSLKKSDSSASNKSKGKHSKSASEDPNHLRIVELEQDASGSFGISIAGGLNSPIGDAPVIIASLNPAGPAAISGKLRTGDKILNINGTTTEGMTHNQVINMLRASKKVTLHVVQGEAVSITGQRSRHVSGEGPDVTLKDVNMELEDDGQPPQFKTITLNRGPEGLGFSIVGGHGSPHGDLPIYVKTVFNKGAAADEGTLSRGDQILSVNGQSLDGFTHEEAVNILKNTQGIVTLGILS